METKHRLTREWKTLKSNFKIHVAKSQFDSGKSLCGLSLNLNWDFVQNGMGLDAMYSIDEIKSDRISVHMCKRCLKIINRPKLG